jgi:hypothetical protein
MSLCAEAYNDEAYVRRAASLAETLIHYQRRWHGVKTETAIEQAAQTHNLPRSVFDALRYPYRWPKSIAVGTYAKLLLAAEQIKSIDERLKCEIKLAEADGFNEENSAAFRFALAANGPEVSEEAQALGIGRSAHDDRGRRG